MHCMVKAGDAVAEGREAAMVESMKREIPVVAEAAGTVAKRWRDSAR